MNLHILPDHNYSEKFIEFVDKYFPMDDHIFLITTSRETAKSITNNDAKRIKILSIRSLFGLVKCLNNKTVKDLFGTCTRVYIHFLKESHYLLAFRYAKSNHTLTWISWGADIYGDLSKNLLEDETKKLLPVQKGFKKVLSFKKITRPIKKSVISKLDYIAMDYKEEYELIASNYKTNALYKEFHYPNPIDFSMLDCSQISSKLPVILKVNQFHKLVLVGNSSFPTNNHISILHFLKSIDNTEFGVICPLSNKTNSVYIDSVIKVGHELFGERFIPLKEFLKPDEYLILLNKIDVAIMNHYRQQGKGNIMPLIYLGKKVFLRENTITYKALCTMGIKPGSIDRLMKGDKKDFFTPLTKEEMQSNKQIIKKAYSEEEDLRKMKALFDI